MQNLGSAQIDNNYRPRSCSQPFTRHARTDHLARLRARLLLRRHRKANLPVQLGHARLGVLHAVGVRLLGGNAHRLRHRRRALREQLLRHLHREGHLRAGDDDRHATVGGDGLDLGVLQLLLQLLDLLADLLRLFDCGSEKESKACERMVTAK